MSPGADGEPSGSPVVCVIDDDASVRDSLKYLIESVGLRVQAFASAQEFLEYCDRDTCGCAIVDVRMPGMSGLDLQDRLRSDGCELPLIFLTAFADVPMAVKALKTGAVEFLEKPVNHQSLLNMVQKAVAKDVARRRTLSESAAIRERYASLTAREREVMEEVVNGNSSREIGEDLDIASKTVEAHRAKIMKKMGARSVAHLIHMAHRLGLPVTAPLLSDAPPSA